MADQNENNVPVVNPSAPPAAGAILPQWAVVALTVLVAVAGILPTIPGIPPVALAIAGVVTAIGVAFGIASPGIRRTK